MFKHSLGAGLACAFACLAVTTTPIQATADDLKLLGGSSMRTVFPELLPQFERSSGHKVTVEYGTLGAIADRVNKGDNADVAIVTAAQNDALRRQGKLLADSRADLATVGYAVFVKKDAARPALGTVDAFKSTMLSAKSIALGDPSGGGPLGVYTGSLMQRLGLTEAIKAKVKLYPSGTEVAEAVAKGASETGIGLASDAVTVPGLVSVLLPGEIQNYTTYTLGIVASSKHVDAAKMLVAFLTSTTAKRVLATNGFETP